METPLLPPSTSLLHGRAAPRKWIMPSPLSLEIERLHDHELLNTLLARRGLMSRADADAFLDHAAADFPDPWRLPDLHAAVERICRAVASRERVAIFGDYDVDGITSSAIIWNALRPVVADERDIVVRLPTRAEGYGLSATALQELAASGATLLIAVDCASTDDRGVALARSLGLDVIIIDHHHMTTTGPHGALTISPARPDGGFYREMAAAALTLLVARALEETPAFARFRQAGGAASLVDLAALGAVADVSRMTGHNRLIVREGIRTMRRSPRTGLKALCDVASIDLTTVNSTRIGFNICPRLNAAGRMGNPRPAFDLLLETDATRAFELATELDSINRVRQAETESVIAAVIDRFEADSEKIESPLLVQSSEGWRTGILGLAAGKLVERLCRPVILLREEGDIATGSCRSVPGLHIVDLLRRHDQLLDRYGGHRQAAGLTMPRENVSLLRNALMADPVIAAMDLPFSPELVVDAVLEPQMVNFETARTIMQLSPYGVGNPEPLFVLPGVSLLRSETMGQDRTHLRLVWRGTHGVITAPFFGAAERAGEAVAGSKIDIACHLAIDRWNGRPRLDVRVVDFRRST